MKKYTSPRRLIIYIIISIIISQAIVTALLVVLMPYIKAWYNLFVDAFLLIIILSPALYLFIFRPMSREIIERRQVEKELQEKERFLSNVFSSIQDGLSILDKDMNIIRVNPAMEKWYEHAMPLVGKKCYKAYHCRDERCEVCPTFKTLETGDAARDVVPKTGSKGKVVGWLDLYSFPLIDSSTGLLTGVIEYIRDITERRKAEEDVMTRDYQLEVLSRTSVHINAILETPVILRTLVTSAIELVGTEGGAAGLCVDGKMVFTEYHKDGKAFPVNYVFERGHGVPGWVIDTKRPYFTNDVEHDPHVTPELRTAIPLHNLANVPIISGKGELLGCLEIFNKVENRPFDVEDMFMLQGLAASAAVALENARILSGLR